MKPTVSNFLISCLVGIYIFQFYNGYTLFMLYFSSAVDCPHWQVSSGQTLVWYMIQIQYTIDREIFIIKIFHQQPFLTQIKHAKYFT